MDKVDELKKRLEERLVTGFAINRIPPKTKKEFIQFAKDEYCDDRGFALNFLWQFYTGVLSSGVEHLEDAIINLQKDVDALKKQPVETEKKIKMMDGRTR